MFSANQHTKGLRKDSGNNAEQTGEFIWNMATYGLRDAVNQSAQELDHGIDEFEIAGLEKLPLPQRSKPETKWHWVAPLN